jgi:aryl-alcohol dehydrogenase-like predicted oxidoreductase
VASRWHVGSVITGSTSVDQLKEYLPAIDIKLDEETLAEIEAIHKEYPNPNWTD